MVSRRIMVTKAVKHTQNHPPTDTSSLELLWVYNETAGLITTDNYCLLNTTYNETLGITGIITLPPN